MILKVFEEKESEPKKERVVNLRMRQSIADNSVLVYICDEDGNAIKHRVVLEISQKGVYRWLGLNSTVGFDRDDKGRIVDLQRQ